MLVIAGFIDVSGTELKKKHIDFIDPTTIMDLMQRKLNFVYFLMLFGRM